MQAARKHTKEGGKKRKKAKTNLFVVPKTAPKKEVVTVKTEKKSLLETKKVTDLKKKEQNKEIVKEQPKEEIKIIKTVTNPKLDKAFQQTLKHVKTTRDKQKTHQPPAEKALEVEKAAVLPVVEQQKKNDKSADFESIKAVSATTKAKKFTPETFKDKLKEELSAIEKNLPIDHDGIKVFKEEKPLRVIKDNVGAGVGEEKNKISGSLETSTNQKDAPASNLPTITEEPLPLVVLENTTKPINQKSAVAKKKHKTEISMEKESQSVDDLMEKNEVTEEQLANSNEPKFTEALTSKKTAQAEAKNAPNRYRTKERAILKNAKNEAGVNTNMGFMGMFNTKSTSANAIFDKQTSTQQSDKEIQKKINDDFEVIYNKTKTDVSTKLDGITEQVDLFFEEGGSVDKARMLFESNVEKKLSAIYGWFKLDDFIFGEDDKAIKKVFKEEKNRFIKSLDYIFDDIATLISDGLNETMDLIDTGRKATIDYYNNLDAKQKELAQDGLDMFTDKYNDLEETVDAMEQEMASSLAEKYKENVTALRASFDKIKEEVSATWLESAINFIGGVIETIIMLTEMLFNLLAAIVSAIKAIISDPIGFLKNLFQGIKLGFENFLVNIKTHLITAVIKWLTGSLGDVGIKLPKDLLSLKGIFNLTMQILGLTWDYFRLKAVKLLGEPMVAGMEKGIEVFLIIKEQGITGIWEYIKEQFTDLKEMVIGAIKEMLITKVIQAGIKWIMGLLSPAGAFVKAAMLIIDVVRFFVEKAAQIIELVNAFIGSVKAVAEGSLEAVAKNIENVLAKTLPVLIGFLAALVGVTGLTSRVQKIIKRLRRRIDKAINKLIKKAKKTFGKLMKKGKAKVGQVKDKLFNWWKKDKEFKSKDGESHKLYYKGKQAKATLMVASNNPQTIDNLIAALQDKKKTAKQNTAFKELKDVQKKIKKHQGNLNKSSFPKEKKQDEYDALQKQLNNAVRKLSELMPVIETAIIPKAIMPAFNMGVKAQSFKAMYITKEQPNQTPKGEDADKNKGNSLPGWGLLQASMTDSVRKKSDGTIVKLSVRDRDNYVKMHLLHHKIGGKAADSNLTPAKSGINTRFYNQLEKHAVDDAFGENSKKQVLWFNVNISYHGKTVANGVEGVDYSAYPNKFSASYGHMEHKNKKWEKKGEAKPFGEGIEAPEFRGSSERIYYINKMGPSIIGSMSDAEGKGVSNKMAAFIYATRRPYNVENKDVTDEKFIDWTDFENRLATRKKRGKSELPSSYDKDLNLLKTLNKNKRLKFD